MIDETSLREYIQILVEKRIREADVTDGSKVPFGSDRHMKDLEVRISDLSRWRDKQRKGSEARANYARLINRLRGELKSAKRAAEKKKIKESIESDIVVMSWDQFQEEGPSDAVDSAQRDLRVESEDRFFVKQSTDEVLYDPVTTGPGSSKPQYVFIDGNWEEASLSDTEYFTGCDE
jgi:hypothetical protein